MLQSLLAVLAIAPGVYAWWTGRTLLARTDDPAFPELVLARAQRTSQIVVTVAVLSAFIPGGSWLWAFPLFVATLLAGGFPFRRALYGETWGIAGYMRYALFSSFGMVGFWLTLAFAPILILSLVDGWGRAAPVESATIAGAVFTVVLVIWEHLYPRLWLALHRASPLRRADLDPRFEEIVRRSTVSPRPPEVFRYGAPGGYVMNAVALPSMRHPRVAFGDTLLELLSPDEIAAIFGHEVAHLEHYDRRRMLRLRLVTYFILLGGTSLPAVLLAWAPAVTWAVKLAWPMIVLVLLALRMSKSQAHETESDLRAGALTGDPEAMVQALTKLHHYSRVPRRWPYDFERASTHPSLARRIQALRTQGTAATAPPTARLGAAIVLRSTEPGAYAALDDQRAYWFDGVPASATAESISALREWATSYRAVAYADLIELRVAVGRGGARSLLARDRSGKSWSIPLRADDVAAAQSALDVLDVRLSDNAREDWSMKARAVATLLALALVGAGDFSWPWLPLLITLAKPSKASLATMGSMAVLRSLLLAAAAGTVGIPALDGAWQLLTWLSVTAAFGIGVVACRLAWRWARGDERPARPQPAVFIMLVVLSVLFVGALALARMSGSSDGAALSLPVEGPAPGVALLMAGVGAAFLTYRDTLRRRSGVVLVGLALVVGALGVDVQRLFARGGNGLRSLTWQTGHAEVAGRVELKVPADRLPAYRLSLSPSGRRFAVQSPARRFARYVDDGDDEMVSMWRFTIGGAPDVDSLRRVTGAIELAFVDDDRVIALRPTDVSGDSLEVSAERAVGRDSVPLFRWRIPAHYAPTLSVDPASGSWRVVGHDVRAGSVVTSAGRIGSDSVRTTRLPAGTPAARSLYTYRDGASLMATFNATYGARQILLTMLGFYPTRWDVWHVANGERRSLGVSPGMPECGGRDDAVLCVARGRSATSLWRVGAGESGVLSPLGALPTNLHVWDIGPDARLAAASYDGSTLAVVDPVVGRAMRIPLGGGVRLQGSSQDPGAHSHAADVAVGPGVVALLVTTRGTSEVVFYRVR